MSNAPSPEQREVLEMIRERPESSRAFLRLKMLQHRNHAGHASLDRVVTELFWNDWIHVVGKGLDLLDQMSLTDKGREALR